MIILDIAGREILPGSYIVYSVRQGLNIARVLAIRHSIHSTGIKTNLSVRCVDRNVVDGTFCKRYNRCCLRNLSTIAVLAEVSDRVKILFV